MTSFSLAGKHVVVTGAGRGLGAAMALAAGAAGADLTLIARSRQQLDEVAISARHLGVTARSLTADLSTADGVSEASAELLSGQSVDGIVHAAGIQHRADIVDFPDEEIRRVLAVNLEAPLLLSRDVGRAQIEAGRKGSHVFVGSLGSNIAIPRAIAYTAAKSGLMGVVRTMAAEWAPHGIRANLVSPGYFHTELTSDLLADEAAKARVLSRIPANRLGDPEELGGAVVFLLSSAAAYVTGQQIVVDGGWLAS